MFEGLTQRFNGVFNRIRGRGKITEENVAEALRRFIDSHQPELIESQIRSDIEWGLHGQD